MKLPTKKSKTFQLLFIANYKTFWVFRRFEQLSSSIGWRGMAFAQIGQLYLLLDFIEKPKIWFSSHNFGTRNARKPTL